jgi:hypothetical protein
MIADCSTRKIVRGDLDPAIARAINLAEQSMIE